MIFRDCKRYGDDDLPPRLSHFEYLNLSNRPEAGKTRALLDRWIQDYPSSHRKDLVVEIQSGDDIRFDSAVFELAVATIIQRQKNSILAVEPQIGSKGRNPDFLCCSPMQSEFVVECADARHLSSEDEGRQKHLDDVINAINEIPGENHRIFLEYSDRPRRAIKKSKIQEPIANWLSQLDADADLHTGDRLEFEVDGIQYKCEPIKARSEVKGIVGAYSRAAAWMSSQSDSLGRSLKKKSTRYGDLGRPYIVALNAPTPFHPHEDLFDVLFGSEAISFDPNKPHETSRLIRRNDGSWCGPKGWSNTRVSGVLLAGNIGPWSAARRDLWYFEHPQPAHHIANPFPDIARIAQSGGQVALKDGTKSSEIFDLEAGWPE